MTAATTTLHSFNKNKKRFAPELTDTTSLEATLARVIEQRQSCLIRWMATKRTCRALCSSCASSDDGLHRRPRQADRVRAVQERGIAFPQEVDVDKRGRMPALFHGIRSKSAEVVRALIAAGVSVDVYVQAVQETGPVVRAGPVQMALAYGAGTSVLEVLFKHGCSPVPATREFTPSLIIAAVKDDVESMRILLSQDPVPDLDQVHHNVCALSAAIVHRSHAAFDVLLEAGADPWVVLEDPNLHGVAKAWHGRLEVVGVEVEKWDMLALACVALNHRAYAALAARGARSRDRVAWFRGVPLRTEDVATLSILPEGDQMPSVEFLTVDHVRDLSRHRKGYDDWARIVATGRPSLYVPNPHYDMYSHTIVTCSRECVFKIRSVRGVEMRAVMTECTGAPWDNVPADEGLYADKDLPTLPCPSADCLGTVTTIFTP